MQFSTFFQGNCENSSMTGLWIWMKNVRNSKKHTYIPFKELSKNYLQVLTCTKNWNLCHHSRLAGWLFYLSNNDCSNKRHLMATYPTRRDLCSMQTCRPSILKHVWSWILHLKNFSKSFLMIENSKCIQFRISSWDGRLISSLWKLKCKTYFKLDH